MQILLAFKNVWEYDSYMATRKKPIRPEEQDGLQIKTFPAHLRWQIKEKAASLQMTVREYAVMVFEAALKGGRS